MNIIRWNPYRYLNRMGGCAALPDSEHVPLTLSQPKPAAVEWKPKVDIVEGALTHTIHLDVPGVNQEDLTISLTENRLIVEGRKEPLRDPEGIRPRYQERRFGRFKHTFRLPAAVERTDIRARYANGVLSIILPKRRGPQPRNIEIE